ncbi:MULTISPECIES: helix-turn-helix domain-containing protein [Rhizobium/Agrobacterium group]|uniref:helix-turn-helix domain-containing protein n=1 Tax=Rhizobium/Agrobacterium group TaxID=227290 RepID=UPI000B405962|nr:MULTISPECIES: helix-turn-helix transcriptional regulator [Rhizobium/Agrobacterium group]MCF1481652.1 helix-turn-helix transcriptional regulator [Allorhizobium ampelinum]NSZ42577.1 helix-turn-helix transcriptional regulator [Agrobacterium vitis]NTA26285.1 helix-turn-helix transcriptional regulator [Allorhizobium ampelinum]OVE95588.1 transcriptional regulator [Allorhizobium ampelinum]
MQTIITPSGETLVVLPLAEYESLIDRSDIAAADKVKADIAAGDDELVPAEVVNQLLADENPVKVWRMFRKMTARELAEQAGISAPYISEIESGKKDGSFATMKKIAEALRVDLDDLA